MTVLTNLQEPKDTQTIELEANNNFRTIKKDTTTRNFLIIIAGILLVGFTALISVMMTRAVNPGCANYQEHWPQGFENDQRYMDAVEIHEVPEKNVRVLKTLMTGRCYVVPMVEQKDPNVGVPFHLVQQPLSDELLASMADAKAVDFCEGFPAFQLTSEPPLPVRKRRGVLPNQCADSTIVQCQDLVTVECTTGPGIPSTGGIFDMKTTCLDPTKFKIEVVDRCKELQHYEGQRRQKCYQNFYRDAATALFQMTGRAPNPRAQLGK